MTKKQRSELGRLLNSLRKTRGGGRPRSNAPRCECGAMTLKRALANRHRCVAKALDEGHVALSNDRSV